MDNEALEQVLVRHPLFKEMSPEDLSTFTQCGSQVAFEPDHQVFCQQDQADAFYLIEEGRVAVELQMGDEEPVVIQTLDPGEILGWSWIFPPYEWHFDARAMEAVKAIALDARCIRAKLDDNPKLGYWLMQQFSRILMDRLSSARIQVMDIYNK